jgi:hypothetical protein
VLQSIIKTVEQLTADIKTSENSKEKNIFPYCFSLAFSWKNYWQNKERKMLNRWNDIFVIP